MVEPLKPPSKEPPAKWTVFSVVNTDVENVPNSVAMAATSHQRFVSRSAAETWAQEYSAHYPELRMFVVAVPDVYYVNGQVFGGPGANPLEEE